MRTRGEGGFDDTVVLALERAGAVDDEPWVELGEVARENGGLDVEAGVGARASRCKYFDARVGLERAHDPCAEIPTTAEDDDSHQASVSHPRHGAAYQ
jgi:hypothetical protein